MRKLSLFTMLCFVYAFTVVPVMADSVTGLTTFTGGSPAYADSINANFGEIADSVDDNDARITSMMPGVLPMSASAFQANSLYLKSNGSYFGVANTTEVAVAPFTLPFKCTITELEARIKKENTIFDIIVGLHNNTQDVSENLIPIDSVDTSSWTASSNATIISTGPISYSYDPSALNWPWYIGVEFEDAYPNLRVYWVKVYYTVP
jgi:hypothetical protein